MTSVRFEWDTAKNAANIEKHGVSFEQARAAFADKSRIIQQDVTHSHQESRYFCYGKVEGAILTVRFTYRNNVIRIFGAAYWRKGKKLYEQEKR